MRPVVPLPNRKDALEIVNFHMLKLSEEQRIEWKDIDANEIVALMVAKVCC